MLRVDAIKKARAKKQAGFIVTAELLLITVILVVGLVTGMTKLRDQTIAELSDTGSAIGSINQSYGVEGTQWTQIGGSEIANTSGWAFADAPDTPQNDVVGGDTQVIVYAPASVSTTTTAGEVPTVTVP